MKNIINLIVKVTNPLVWVFASKYGIKVNRPAHASGKFPLMITGGKEQILNQIPSSVYFNTQSGRIVVGFNTVFGEYVKVLTGKHMNIEESKRFSQELHSVVKNGRDILIGSGCYIGSGAIIIGPVTIGDYSVIGAGSVVTKDVPALSFVAGNPAKVVRFLTEK